MRLQRSIAALLCCAGIAVAAAAANGGSIEGRVNDGDGTALAGVTVEVRDGDRVLARVVTAADGTFRTPVLPAGDYVMVTRMGIAPPRGRWTAKIADNTVSYALLQADLQFSESVTVTETRRARLKSETPATIGSVTAESIGDSKPSHPSEIFSQVPGVWVNVTGGEGHQTAIRQPLNTNPVYLYLEDGVPTRSTGFFNHNALYEVNLPASEGIEVTKGPGSALYGSDAIGGVVNVLTKSSLGEPGVAATLETGSDGWRRILGDVHWSRGQHGLRATVNATASDGWRAATDYDRQSATLRWDVVQASAVLKTLVAASRIDQQTAGSSALPEADYESRPAANLTPISFRAVEALRISTDYHRLARNTTFNVIPYFRFNSMDLLPNWTLTFDPTVSESRNVSFGAIAKVERELPRWKTRVVAGADTDYSPGSRFEYVIRPQTSPSGLPSGRAVFSAFTPGATVYDYDVAYLSFSPYAQAEWTPVARLNVSAGLRLDTMSYDYDDRLTAPPTARHRRPEDGSRSFTHVSPKLGITYQWTPALSGFASYRHAFRAPSEGQLFRQGTARNTFDLEPVKADNVEVGLRYAGPRGVTLDLSAYRLDKRDDILSYQNPLDGATESVNAGHTRHVGVELGAKAPVSRWASVAVSYSHSQHTYEEWVVDPRLNVDFSGNEQEIAPRHLGTAVLQLGPLARTSGALEASWLGGYWMDAANTQRYDGHLLANARVHHDFPRGMRAFAKVLNVFDTLYAESSSYTLARGRELAPGRPRTLFVGIEFSWRQR